MIDFKGPLGFYKNYAAYIALEKAKQKEKEFKSDINKIVKAGKKSKE